VAKKERGLGRGLEALLSTTGNDSAQVQELEISNIIPRANQPRQHFSEESLQELADSIRAHGILQPVLVRPSGADYEIVAGERRWRAADQAGLKMIPALVRELNDVDVAEISLVENLQREDLSPIEEARAYRNLLEQYNYTQEMLAERVGKSRAHIANTIRLLNLSPEIIDMIDRKQITSGHARALLAIRNGREQIAVANDIIMEKLSVRQVEQKMQVRKGSPARPPQKAALLKEIEDRLQNHLGTKAEIAPQRQGGKISISYYDEDDLERILAILGL
jgi:ParB family transcriptional regulator, chromosome partitioning protein